MEVTTAGVSEIDASGSISRGPDAGSARGIVCTRNIIGRSQEIMYLAKSAG